MARVTKLDRLPEALKAELIKRLLNTTDNYADIAQWLYAHCGKRYSKSSIGRFAQTLRSVHGGLLELGIPSDTLSANVGRLEKLGAYLVQREFLNRRIEALKKDIFGDFSTIGGRET